MSRLREFAVFVLFLGALFAIVAHCDGCGAVKRSLAEEAYYQERHACVKKYAREADIRACDAIVVQKWEIAETVKDAGAATDSGGDQ